MIYLKKFNESVDQLYVKLEGSQSDHIKGAIDIRKETLNMLHKWGIKYSKQLSNGHSERNKGSHNGEFYFVYFEKLDYLIELEDEWYLLHTGLAGYKCDQLDGLEQCLKDNFIRR